MLSLLRVKTHVWSENLYTTPFFECAHMYQRHCILTLSSHTPDFFMDFILKTLKQISNVFLFPTYPSSLSMNVGTIHGHVV
jgi:hypothetical protein